MLCKLKAAADRRMVAFIAAGRTRAEREKRLDELAAILTWLMLLGAIVGVGLFILIFWVAIRVAG